MEIRKRNFLVFPLMVVVIALLGSAAAPSQFIEARLGNIERRIDQVQSRVDGVERELRMQSISTSQRPEVSREMVLEIQRQHNSLAEQVVGLEQRMLELRKTIDRLAAEQAEKKEEAKPKPAEGTKRKP